MGHPKLPGQHPTSLRAPQFFNLRHDTESVLPTGVSSGIRGGTEVGDVESVKDQAPPSFMGELNSIFREQNSPIPDTSQATTALDRAEIPGLPLDETD